MLKDCGNLTQNKPAPTLEGGEGVQLGQKGPKQFSS